MNRLRSRPDYLAVARGTKVSRPGLVLQALPRPGAELPARVGFTVTRKVGNAVIRNRVRRRLKEAARQAFASTGATGIDFVVIGRRAALDRPFDRLLQDLLGSIAAAGVAPVQEPAMGGNNRNFIIAIVLSIAVLIAWQYFVAEPQIETAQQQATQQTAAADVPQPAAAGDIPVPAGEVLAAVTAPAEATGVCSGLRQFASRDAALAADPRVLIQTPALAGSVNLCGGRIDDLHLTGYHETVDDTSPTIILLSPATGPEGYFAEFGWTSADRALGLPGKETMWSAPANAVLTPDAPLTLIYDNGTGLRFTRIISVDDRFMFTVEDTVANIGGAAVEIASYGRVTRLGEPASQGFFILHEGMIGVIGDDGLEQVDYKALVDAPKAYEPATTGWLGITDKYWAAALIPAFGASYVGHFTRFTEGGLRYQADFLGDTATVAAGATTTVTNRLFAGAKQVAVINEYRDTLGIDRFDLLVDWGWFYFITKPMFQLLDWFYRLVGNFGISILLVTVLIKGVFFPLANRSYRSMASMRKVTPQIQALRERHKDDRAKQQQAMLELYRKEKINPVSGCWPILIQIPVFFSLYKVLFVTIEMRHSPFFGWIQDLSAPDPTSFINLFGLLPFESPAFLQIGIWPLIMGVTMWVQFQLNPQTPGTPKWIFNVLPVVFTYMLSSFPAGLVIYWAWNNALSVLQQSIIMRRNGVPVDLFGNISSTFKKKPKGADAKPKV